MLANPSINLLYVMAELGLADLLDERPRTCAELVACTGAHPGALQRVLRALAAFGLVNLRNDGRFDLTPAGACLRTDTPNSLRSLVRFSGQPAIQRAWSELLYTVRTGQPAFDYAVGVDFGTYLDQHPEAAALFHASMASTSEEVAAAVAATYRFRKLKTVVDVGGGTGVLLRAILRAFPHMLGTILDLPHARRQAEQAIAADGLDGRCQFVEGNFFVEVPEGADVYLLKSIIHDWDDARSLAILKSCRRAMHSESRLLLVESLLPTVDKPAMEVVLVDLIMLTMGIGRQRTEAEHRTLLAQAGLHLQRMLPITSGRSLLEARPIRS